MLRPGGRRRRRRPSGLRHALRWLPLTLLAVVVVGLIVGSLADVGARSAPYRASTDQAYGALATSVVAASNSTGKALASLMAKAPTETNAALPFTARAQLQDGLDEAVSATAAQSAQAEAIATPAPAGAVAAQFAAVMGERAAAAERLRSTIDQLLGMSPLPVAGAPSSTAVVRNGPLLSPTQASVAMGAAGAAFEQADARYRDLLADIRRNHYRIRLPSSVWVPAPQSTAPLGAVQLDATAPALDASVALAPFHHLVVTAVGLEPPAVPPTPTSPDAASGVIGVSCGNAQSIPPSAAPTILPPTPTLAVKATITNCGTVAESDVSVTATVALLDLPGTAAPPRRSQGGTKRTKVTLRSGGAVALTFGPFPVADGHRYVVTVAIAIPVGQQLQPQGATQQFLVQITG
jgi:hypothetical protein